MVALISTFWSQIISQWHCFIAKAKNMSWTIAEKEREDEKKARPHEKIRKEQDKPGGAKEQLLRAAPLRSSERATGSSHWFTLQDNSCLEDGTHTQRTVVMICPAVWHTQKVHYTHSSYRWAFVWSNQGSFKDIHIWKPVAFHWELKS